MFLSDRIILFISLALPCAFGLVRLIRSRLRISTEIDFASEFLQKINAYIDSNGRDNKAYGWLLHRSTKMQMQMGHLGFYATYRPPYANFHHSNYPIILNMLPELRKALEDDYSRNGDLANQYALSIQEAIIRYAGVMEDRESEIVKSIRNPVVWFREGIRIIVALPLSILKWLGALTEKSFIALTSSKVFHLIAAVVSVVSFVSAFMGIALGWDQFQVMVKGWFNA